MRQFPLPPDAFAHGNNLHPDGLGRWLNVLANQSTERTETTVHAYADASNGNDANDGLGLATAKATIQAADLVLPLVLGAPCALHLRGTHTLTADAYLSSRMLLRNAKLLIDGGPDVSVVAPADGGVYTADIASTTSIGLSTAGWVAGAYRGYFVEVLTGPAAGQTRMIRQDQTATTITPARNFSVSPGVGATFRIVRPATRITAATAQTFGIVGNLGFGTVQLQRVTIDGNCYTQIRNNAASVWLSHVVLDAANSAAVVVNGCRGGGVQAVGGKADPITFVADSANTQPSVGIGIRGADGMRVLDSVVRLSSSYVAHWQMNNSQGSALAGTGLTRITTWDCQAPDAISNPFLASTSGYAPTKISGSAGDGLLAKASSLSVSGAVDFSDNAGHGIQLVSAFMQCISTRPTGTGNAKAGCYARQCSNILLTTGQTPTLTGAVGELAVSDPAAQESTWAAITGGTSVAVLAQMTTAMVGT